jgi:translation initiation factor 2 subunit 2
MADEPLFDPSLKKRKKKNVVFIEDPLGADADPTKPAPETIDSTTINGEAVDLGPSTAHELMKGSSADSTSSNKEKEEEDFKAMFGDMKKKKKKKEIPMDFVCFFISRARYIDHLIFYNIYPGR